MQRLKRHSFVTEEQALGSPGLGRQTVSEGDAGDEANKADQRQID